VTESIEAVRMSKKAGWGVMASHRRFASVFKSYNCKIFSRFGQSQNSRRWQLWNVQQILRL